MTLLSVVDVGLRRSQPKPRAAGDYTGPAGRCSLDALAHRGRTDRASCHRSSQLQPDWYVARGLADPVPPALGVYRTSKATSSLLPPTVNCSTNRFGFRPKTHVLCVELLVKTVRDRRCLANRNGMPLRLCRWNSLPSSKTSVEF